MKYLHAIFALSLSASITALPTTSPYNDYTIHEKRTNIKLARSHTALDRRGTLPLSIALKQRNLENGYESLLDVSHPASPNYGKHWTTQKIAETFSAHPDSIDAVISWLNTSGIGAERLSVARGRHWINVDASISEVENLLKTEYKVYDHPQTGKPVLGCDDYSIPASLLEHVDFFTPTVHEGMGRIPLRQREVVERKKDGDAPIKSAWIKAPKNRSAPNFPNTTTASSGNTTDLTSCTDWTSIDCIRSLYNIPLGSANVSSFGVMELDSTFNQSDLNNFYSQLNGNYPSQGTAPNSVSIDGGSLDVASGNYQPGEATLDLEIAIPLVYPQNVTIYELGTPTSEGSFGNFLDAISKSICTEDNDPTSTDCGDKPPTAVISISWGGGEADSSPAYNERQCNEYMKLGLQGITILFSSGDNGVQSADESASCTRFQPLFPASCPYVTAVGATTLNSTQPAAGPEIAANGFGSGGGFSDVFSLPSYQSDAVSKYLTTYPPPYNSSQFNSSGFARGYPDVSANGQWFQSFVQGEIVGTGGTSMSAPIVGAVITLINEERLRANKTTVGFVNPTFYANPEAFNDVVVGVNNDIGAGVGAGCGTEGFAAQPGWDPVTGLGTPDYEKLLKAFMALN